MTADQIDDAAWNEERRYLARRIRLEEFVVGHLDGSRPPMPEPMRIPIRSELASVRHESGVAHGLCARDHAVLHEGVHAARILRAHVGSEIQTADLAAEMRRIRGGIDPCDGADTAASRHDRTPCRLDLVADGRDDSKTRNHDTPFTQPRLSMECHHESRTKGAMGN